MFASLFTPAEMAEMHPTMQGALATTRLPGAPVVSVASPHPFAGCLAIVVGRNQVEILDAPGESGPVAVALDGLPLVRA